MDTLRIKIAHKIVGLTGLAVVLPLAAACHSGASGRKTAEGPWAEAERNGRRASEVFRRTDRLLEAWYKMRGRDNYLLPRYFNQRIWNGKDTAADLWSHLISVAWLTGDDHGREEVRRTLADEIRLTTRVGAMGDTYSLDENRFTTTTLDMQRVIFSAAEYVKDGLLPVIDLT